MDEPMRDDDAVSLDAVLELLASRWCRYALYELQKDGPLKPDELVRRVAAREYDDPGPDQRETVRTRLHHTYFPKLEAHDIVEWDGDAVATGKYARLVEPYLEWAKEWEANQ